jgi:hypothetical protein
MNRKQYVKRKKKSVIERRRGENQRLMTTIILLVRLLNQNFIYKFYLKKNRGLSKIKMMDRVVFPLGLYSLEHDVRNHPLSNQLELAFQSYLAIQLLQLEYVVRMHANELHQLYVVQQSKNR